MKEIEKLAAAMSKEAFNPVKPISRMGKLLRRTPNGLSRMKNLEKNPAFIGLTGGVAIGIPYVAYNAYNHRNGTPLLPQLILDTFRP